MCAMRSLAVAALVLALAAAPEPVAGQATVPPTWVGITFETPAVKLRETLGDPVRLTRLPNERTAPELASAPPERKARYVLSFKTPLFLIVSERHGAGFWMLSSSCELVFIFIFIATS